VEQGSRIGLSLGEFLGGCLGRFSGLLSKTHLFFGGMCPGFSFLRFCDWEGHVACKHH